MNIKGENILGDATIVLEQLNERGEKYDLILTDPPYDIGKDFGNNSDKLPFNEYKKLMEGIILSCYDLLKDNGSIIWFGSHRYLCYFQVFFYQIGMYYRRMNIWRYENGLSRSVKEPTTQYEPFLWFSKSPKVWTYNTDDVRVPYKSTERIKYAVKKKDKNGNLVIWQPSDKGAKRGDIWEFPTLAGKAFELEKTNHPSQKPEALITELIKAFCPKKKGIYQGKILDPLHGSGTLGVCCEKLNQQGHDIHWIGIEIEKRWIDIANQRLQRLSEGNLFTIG